MRLAAANISYCLRIHRGIWLGRTPGRLAAVGPEVAGGNSLSGISVCAAHCQIAAEGMYVLRHFAHGQGMGQFAAILAQIEAGPDMIWRPALQVRQREIRLTVASISGAQQREQGLVLMRLPSHG